VRVAIEAITTIIWLPLELMVIATLLRGQYRRFPFILAFVVAEFFAVAAEVPAYWAVYHNVKNATGQRSWIWSFDEVLLQALIYAVVISLIYQATARLESRRLVATSVILGAVVFAAGSFLIHFSTDAPSLGTWVTPWMRDLNLSTAVLDLGLWTLLISARKKDSALLLISGGLGIRFTGEAIGGSLRQIALREHKLGAVSLAKGLSLSGSIAVAVVDLLCLFIWWRALRHAAPVTVAEKKIGSHSANAGSPSETDSLLS
jgi:hypothetical protein